MIMNPSKKLPEVFVLIIPQVTRTRILIYISKWEVVVCHPRRGMRIFVLVIPQMIRIHFSEWEEVVLVFRRLGGVKMFKDIDILAKYGHEYNDVSLSSYDMTEKREFRLMCACRPLRAMPER
jgi:hypothetical protein